MPCILTCLENLCYLKCSSNSCTRNITFTLKNIRVQKSKTYLESTADIGSVNLKVITQFQQHVAHFASIRIENSDMICNGYTSRSSYSSSLSFHILSLNWICNQIALRSIKKLPISISYLLSNLNEPKTCFLFLPLSKHSFNCNHITLRMIKYLIISLSYL